MKRKGKKEEDSVGRERIHNTVLKCRGYTKRIRGRGFIGWKKYKESIKEGKYE